MRRIDKQILEVDSGAREESGEVVKEEREAYRLIAQVGENDFGKRAWAKQSAAQLLFGRHHLVQQFLVFGEFADEAEDKRNVAFGCILDLESTVGSCGHVAIVAVEDHLVRGFQV